MDMIPLFICILILFLPLWMGLIHYAPNAIIGVFIVGGTSVLAISAIISKLIYYRSSSGSFVILWVATVLGAVRKLRWLTLDEEDYIQGLNSEVVNENTVLQTSFQYLGISVRVQGDLDELVDTYAELISEEGEIDIGELKKSELDLFGEGMFTNCSTCPSTGYTISVEVTSKRFDGVSWTIDLCESCFSKIIGSQLEELSRETNLTARVMVDKI